MSLTSLPIPPKNGKITTRWVVGALVVAIAALYVDQRTAMTDERQRVAQESVETREILLRIVEKLEEIRIVTERHNAREDWRR